jgi:putative transposase
LADAEVRILAFCLMTNHVHLVAVPERSDSLSVLLRRVHTDATRSITTHAGAEPRIYGRTGFSAVCWGLSICGQHWLM